MSKRFFDTEIWDKEWFMALSEKHKLFFQFLFSKCDQAGVWTPNFALASTYVGKKITSDDLKILERQIFRMPDGKIFLEDFIFFQYGELTENCPPHRKIISLLKNYGLYERVLKGYQKGSYRLEEKDIDKEEEMEEEKDEEKEKEKKGLEENFEFTVSDWNIYAKKHNKPLVRTLSYERKRKLECRIREPEFNFRQVLIMADQSDFLNANGFFEFDWIIKNDKNYIKVLQGNYVNNGQGTTKNNIEQHNKQVAAELEAIFGRNNG